MAADNGSSLHIRVVTALVIVGTFLAGAGTGAGTFYWALPRRPPPPPPMGLPLRELGLSAEQEQQARTITESHHAEIDAILHEAFPKVRLINDQVEREVRKLLTVEQQRRLDVLKARRPPPPPGPPPFGGHGMGPPPGPPPPFGMGPPPGPPPPE